MSNVFSRFEDGVENAVDAATDVVFKSPLEPAQIAKKAEKQMKQNRLVGAGRQYAPTLYNVLVNPDDDQRLFGFYPTIAAEIEIYLMARGSDTGLNFDGRPLVRFIVDDSLRKGKFDVIAESVSAVTIRKLREEEMEYYGIAPRYEAMSPVPEMTPANVPASVSSGIPAGISSGTPADIPPNDIPPHIPTNTPAHIPVNVPTHIPANTPTHNASVNRGRQYDAVSNPKLDAANERAASEHGDSERAASERNLTERGESETPVPSMGASSLVDLRDKAVYRLRWRRMTIGRDSTNAVVLNDANVSRTHAQLTQDATGIWKLIDLNSTNGTLLNERPVRQALLNDGDRITIGVTTLLFQI